MLFKCVLVSLIIILVVGLVTARAYRDDSPDVRLLKEMINVLWDNREDFKNDVLEELTLNGVHPDFIVHYYQNNLLDIEERDQPSCSKCLAFVGGVMGFINAGLTFGTVRDFAVHVCKHVTASMGYNGDIMCEGIVDNFGPHVFYVLNATDMSAREVCEFHGMCEERFPKYEAGSTTKWPNKETSTRRKRLRLKDERPRKEDMIRIAHISDIHFDEKYAPGSAAECDLNICCRDYWEGTGIANEWGDYSCSVPIPTVELLFQFLADKQPHFVMNTGDIPPSVLWEESQMGQIAYSRWVAEAIERFMPNVRAYTTIGNHEMHPTNLYYGQREQIKALNRNITEMYQSLSNWTDEAVHTMEIAGYYFMDLLPGLKIMAINGNYGYRNNLYGVLLPDSPDWLAHSEYLENAFIEARDHEDKVLILHHESISRYEGFTFYREWINRMMDTYGDTILFQLQGHMHRDVIQMSADENINATSAIFIMSTMGTNHQRNPTVRIMYLHPDTHLPMEWDQYYINISAAVDGVTPEILHMYNTREDYGMEDLSLDSLEDFAERLMVDDDLYYLYEWNKHTRGPGTEPEECVGQCPVEAYCDMMTTSPERYEQCMQQFRAHTLNKDIEFAYNSSVTKRRGGCSCHLCLFMVIWLIRYCFVQNCAPSV